jgi:hypothetical protein
VNYLSRYKLRVVIHHTKKPSQHFTATLIGRDGRLYVYDDMKGVEHVATSTGFVAYGIYTKIYASDN